MRLAKNLAIFGGVGLMLSLVIAGLSSVAPSIFGWHTAPFWILSGLASVGAHDATNVLFFALSGTIFYGIVAFAVFRLARRYRAQH